jgi:hypothetical protein
MYVAVQDRTAIRRRGRASHRGPAGGDMKEVARLAQGATTCTSLVYSC